METFLNGCKAVLWVLLFCFCVGAVFYAPFISIVVLLAVWFIKEVVYGDEHHKHHTKKV